MKEKTDLSKLNIPADIDRKIRRALKEKAANGRIACAAVFKVVEAVGISPDIAGAYADLLGLKLIGCQLGLFGHGKDKKAVTPLSEISETLEAAIREKTEDGRLPCVSAWEIAARTGLAKIKVSGACETLGIRIKSCQLGAF